MAKLGGSFDANTIRPSDPDGSTGFPVGLIKAYIKGNEIKPISGDKGSRIEFTFVGADGLGKGMEAKWNVNLFYHDRNNTAEKNAQTQKIASEQISALCWATGVMNLGPEGDLDLLNGKPLTVVSESQNDPQYPNRTNIVGVGDLNGHKPGQPGVPLRVREAAPIQAAATAQPWTPPATTQTAPAPAAAGWGPQAGQAQAPAPQAAPGFAPPVAPAPAASAPVAGGWGAPAAAPAQAPAAAPAGQVPSWAQPR